MKSDSGHWPDNPEPLIRDPNGDYVKYDDLLLAWQESNDYQRLISQLADGIKQIYAITGEDERVADICNPLIESSRLYADFDK